jgi:hypothetical protein
LAQFDTGPQESFAFAGNSGNDLKDIVFSLSFLGLNDEDILLGLMVTRPPPLLAFIVVIGSTLYRSGKGYGVETACS